MVFHGRNRQISKRLAWEQGLRTRGFLGACLFACFGSGRPAPALLQTMTIIIISGIFWAVFLLSPYPLQVAFGGATPPCLRTLAQRVWSPVPHFFCVFACTFCCESHCHPLLSVRKNTSRGGGVEGDKGSCCLHTSRFCGLC